MSSAQDPSDARGRAERERLRRVYETYWRDPRYRKIWSDTRASRFARRRKWSLVERVIAEKRVDLGSAWILELGAGYGEDLSVFRDLGARADRLVALDVLQRVTRIARTQHPWLTCIAADSASMPLRDGRFDLVYQSTMISSVLDPERRGQILAEVRRVLAPGGLFLSYDTRYPNPWNPHTRPLRLRELRSAFPGWSIKSWSLTALPPLVRAVAPLSLGLCRVLEAVPVLRSCMLAVVRKA